MAEQITIALHTKRVPLFVEYLAKDYNQDFKLVEQRPATNLTDDDGEPYHTIVTIEAEESWQFFGLGRDWAYFQQDVEKGQSHA